MTATPEKILVRFAQSQPLFTALGDARRQTIIILLLRASAARSVGENRRTTAAVPTHGVPSPENPPRRAAAHR